MGIKNTSGAKSVEKNKRTSYNTIKGSDGMITFLSSKIAGFLFKKNVISEDYVEICKYGYEVLFFNLFNAAIVLALGIVLNKLLYSIVFFAVFAVVRQYCGGYHSKSTIVCTFVYVLIYLFIMLLATTDITEECFTIPVNLIFCISYISSVIAFAPIDNKNKALDEEEKAKFKKISLILGVILTLLSLSLYKVDLHITAVISLTLLVITALMLTGRQLRKEEICNEKDS